MKKAKFIKTKKQISAKVFNLKFDEVIWVNGNKLVRDKIEHNGVTSIVPILDKKFVILLKQYRYGVDKVLLEVPAGTIDKGENPLKCAKRELIEETGYHGKNWKSLGSFFPSPAYNSCVIYCYSTKIYKKTATSFDPDEVLETKILSFKEVKKLMKNEKIQDMKSFISLQKFFKNY